MSKYIAIDREMSKAFADFEKERGTIELPLEYAEVDYTYVPGKFSSFQQEMRQEIEFRLKHANRKRLRGDI